MDMAARPPGTVRGDTEMTPIDPVSHLAQGSNTSSSRGASNHAETETFDHLGDQLAVAMVADQDLHLRPCPVIGREEHDLVVKRVNIALTSSSGHFRIRGRVGISEMKVTGAGESTDQP
jgi:hypothetical protein